MLLRAIEAVDLVDEQERALALRAAHAGGLEDLLQFRHARVDSRNLHENVIARRADQPRDRRLPLPGGPQKIIELKPGAASRRVSAPSGPARCSWPETSQASWPQTLGKRAGGGSAFAAHAVEKAHGPLCPARASRCPAPGRRQGSQERDSRRKWDPFSLGETVAGDSPPEEGRRRRRVVSAPLRGSFQNEICFIHRPPTARLAARPLVRPRHRAYVTTPVFRRAMARPPSPRGRRDNAGCG